MKKHDIKIFVLFKNIFIGLLADLVNASDDIKCASVTNQKQCETQLTIINLHPDKYTQTLRYYAFAVN